ncbi:MAG: ATP-grasp domain-containing protein [Flavobacteriales bacterium]|nr:ATP-grasp domain-containing protein [Flavobacteriales bacterium]
MKPLPFYTRLHIWLQRLVRWEFWPWRIVYIPVSVYWFFLAIRARGWVFFSAANPCMRFGGLLAYSKSKVNQLVPEKYTPKTLYVDSSETVEQALAEVAATNLKYPLIVKPDIGERGWGVKVVKTENELPNALSSHPGLKLVQEYADLPMELGVMYSRHPQEKNGKITSIVIKDFPKVVGDGKRTLQQLILDNERTRFSYHIHAKRLGHRFCEIPKAGEEIRVVHIGNHMLGTTFFSGNHLIDAELEAVFDELAKQISDFFIGRFDLRTASIEDLKKGNFIVVEVNGVNSEPCHIFHPGRSIFLAWRDLFTHWKRIADISIANHKNGVPYASYWEIRSEIRKHRQKLKMQE